MFVFSVDGNIGCGKSSVLDFLHMHYGIPIDPEPVEKWNKYLTDMYKNGKGAFEFQVRVWLDRCWIQQRPNMAPIIMERSPYFQSNVFVPVNLQNGKLAVREYHMLQEMYARSGNLWAPRGYIYLRSDPQKCGERVLVRNRASEQGLTQAYLHTIHSLHEQAYFQAVVQGLPVICIDVEGKTVPQIAAEVYMALVTLGYPSCAH